MTYNLRYPIEARELTARSREAIKQWCGDCAWFYADNGDSELYVENRGENVPMGATVICAQAGNFIVKHPEENFEVLSAAAFHGKYQPV